MFLKTQVQLINLKENFKGFIRKEEGLTVVEYAIAGGLIGLAVVAAFTALGTQVATSIGALQTAITPVVVP